MTSSSNFVIPPSELIINSDGSIFHLHLKPHELSTKVVVCGDPERVDKIAAHFDTIEVNVQSREFHTITGTYKGKRITALSHGIGGDNIEIVLNELDALANIDFESRTAKPEHTTLDIVRIGTSGGLQTDVPIGSYVAATYAIGFDGVLHFYADADRVCDHQFEEALLQGLDWQIPGLRPYVVQAPADFVQQIVAGHPHIHPGVTIACNGFYAPQGRRLRGQLADPSLNHKIIDFEYKGNKITNFEMESAALAGLAAILGHRALTICTIIAGRATETMRTEYKDSLEELIEIVLEHL